jgi:hypothetical protein
VLADDFGVARSSFDSPRPQPAAVRGAASRSRKRSAGKSLDARSGEQILPRPADGGRVGLRGARGRPWNGSRRSALAPIRIARRDRGHIPHRLEVGKALQESGRAGWETAGGLARRAHAGAVGLGPVAQYRAIAPPAIAVELGLGSTLVRGRSPIAPSDRERPIHARRVAIPASFHTPEVPTPRASRVSARASSVPAPLATDLHGTTSARESDGGGETAHERLDPVEIWPPPRRPRQPLTV